MLTLFLFAIQIDLNRASLAQLYALPIDSAIVQAIYEYRSLYGSFKSVYELKNVQGVDPGVFEILKPQVKIAVPFPAREEWGSILDEQKKLASEEPPSKAAIDEWEDLLFSPMNVNRIKFDELLMIDRMTPIDASAVMRGLSQKEIKSSSDLRRITGLSYYSYVSLRRYVQYTDDADKKPHGSMRVALENENRLDVGEDENAATRTSYLEQALANFSNTRTDLQNYYGWQYEDCELLEEELQSTLDTLKTLTSKPEYMARLKLNYEKRLKIGLIHNASNKFNKGYAGIANIGPVQRFYLGNYRVIWGEGLMVDNTDEFQARVYNRSTGIFGDLTDNTTYDFQGAAGSFNFPLPITSMNLKPSFFFSTNVRDAIINPDGTAWRIIKSSCIFPWQKDQLEENSLGINFRVMPFETTNPGTYLAFEGMQVEYSNREVNPDPRWIDIPMDKYEPDFYPEITALTRTSRRRLYGLEFLLPVKNVFFSGEYVRQKDSLKIASAYLVKSRLQYEFFYLNILYRHYDVGFDNPFSRGFAEYRRFEDTPFERPYALLNPEYIAVYDDPAPKPEQGIFMETRYQITRNIILSRAYLDIFENLSHGLINSRAYFEFEFQPVFPVRIRYSEKFMRKYLPRPIMPTSSYTTESSIKVFFFLSNFDALRVEYRHGNVDLTAEENADMNLTGGFLAFSFEHNFITGFTVEGGLALWSTDGMSQWIFEDVGIDFLSGTGMKYYIVTSQKVGDLLMRLKFRQKYTNIAHSGLYNNPEIYYPDAPGVNVQDFINNENSVKVNLQVDYLF